MFSLTSTRVAKASLSRSRVAMRRWLGETAKKTEEPVAAAAKVAQIAEKKKTGIWHSAEAWGAAGALAGWGISGSAIYDAYMQGPEVISLNMTPVLIVYSSLFAVWSWAIIPKNLMLMGCHIANVLAQCNQMRRGVEYKIATGHGEEISAMGKQAAAGGVAIAASILLGPTLRTALVGAELGIASTVAAAPAGPFTVHFWAPMSKWLISGASFMDLYRPTEKISLAQYTALTFTGLFFSRYSLLVKPINYNLSSVNVALFLSSAWHLGRKINADYFEVDKKE
jgi:hypothetical protein